MHPKRIAAEKVLVEDLGDETVVYDLDTNQGHLLSRVAALVLERSDGNTSVAEIGRIVHEESGLPEDEAVVEMALEQLREAGLVTMKTPPPPAGLTRREVAKRLGLGAQAAMLLPFVQSVLAPRPAYAASTGVTMGPATTTEAPPKGSTAVPLALSPHDQPPPEALRSGGSGGKSGNR